MGENASSVIFGNNKVRFDGKMWEPLPNAGKIRMTGGCRNEIPEALLEQRR